MATMNSVYPNGGPVGYWQQWTPLGDDRHGERYLYWDATSETDIAASNMKQTTPGRSDEVSSTTSASPGQSVYMEYTITNLGNTFVSFDIGFYLSTDQFISTSDIHLGTITGAGASHGVTGTLGTYVTIPSWIAAGTYYLGFIVDPNNAVAENNESNNYMQMPNPIKISGASGGSSANMLVANQSLLSGQALTSSDGRFTFIYQYDGNIVLYQNGVALWASWTVGAGAGRVYMQGDGNLVLYNYYWSPVWASNTYNNPGAWLIVQNDGNVVIYSASGTPLWATNTGGR